MAFFEENEQVMGEKGDVRTRQRFIQRIQRRPGKKGSGVSEDQRRKNEDDSAVDLLMELVEGARGALNVDAPLISFESGSRWRVWTTGQATQCLREGLEAVGRQ